MNVILYFQMLNLINKIIIQKNYAEIVARTLNTPGAKRVWKHCCSAMRLYPGIVILRLVWRERINF